MTAEGLQYDRMIDAAFRGVVRQALTQVSRDGLPGEHHFYLTFRTGFPGIELPPHLKAQYPNEMTIVLQFQFYGLEVDDEKFAVTLSFSGVRERIVIPFDAISTFADPSVNFALQFQPVEAAAEAAEPVPEPVPAAPDEPPAEDDDAPRRGQVVALDAFRKK
ncbi:MAG: SspB family protein [Rhodospirillales bacterium]|jgi:uncharacterized protein